MKIHTRSFMLWWRFHFCDGEIKLNSRRGRTGCKANQGAHLHTRTCSGPRPPLRFLSLLVPDRPRRTSVPPRPGTSRGDRRRTFPGLRHSGSRRCSSLTGRPGTTALDSTPRSSRIPHNSSNFKLIKYWTSAIEGKQMEPLELAKSTIFFKQKQTH